MKHHHVDSVVVRCIDYRFREFFDIWCKKHVGQHDLISIPGASKDIDAVLRYVAVSMQAHQPNKIIIIDHQDCAAYGANDTFTAHKNNMIMLRHVLEGLYPGVTVELWYCTLGYDMTIVQ